MYVDTITNPVNAFEALRARAARGSYGYPTSWLSAIGMDAFPGRYERFQDIFTVRDQSVAYPGMTQQLKLVLTIIACDDGRLALHAGAGWSSIYGSHRSEARYVVERTGDTLTVTPTWCQYVPEPLLDNLEVHAGGVTAADYHRGVVTALRASGGGACAMLLANEGQAIAVDPAGLVPLARLVADRPALL